MKKEDFFKLMDGIDDRLVEKYAISDEAEARQKQIRRQRRQRWLNQVTGCAVAAIILGVIGVAMLCASFGIVRMDRQSQKTPVSLGDGNDSQNNENNGDEEKELFGSWMNAPRDACFDPAFERVAYIWALAYEQKNSEHVNGVVSLTPAIIQNMLGYIGNVTLSDGTELTSENATQVLQYDLYYKYLNANASSSAGDYVDNLFAETAKVTMAKLVSDFDVKKAGDYYKVFSDGAKNRTVMMWMEDEEEQELVKNAGCSGGLNEDPQNPETGVYFSISDPCKLGWFLNIDTQISEPVVNSNGSSTYEVIATYSNTLSDNDKINAGRYILGNYGGTITGYIHIFAPAGGTISDIEMSNGDTMYTGNYNNLQVAYRFGNSIAPGSSITVTYKVTTASGVTNPLGVNSTPTLQNYR